MGLKGVGMAFFLHLIGDVTSLQEGAASCLVTLEKEDGAGSTRGKWRSLSEHLATPLPTPFVSAGRKQDSAALARFPESTFMSSLRLRGGMARFLSSITELVDGLARTAVCGKRFGLSMTTGLSFSWLPS